MEQEIKLIFDVFVALHDGKIVLNISQDEKYEENKIGIVNAESRSEAIAKVTDAFRNIYVDYEDIID